MINKNYLKSLSGLFRGVCSLLLVFGLWMTNSFAQISVTGGSGLAATYTSLTGVAPNGLFAAINATAQTGNTILVTITGDATETGATSLNAGAWSTISITPTGGAARTLSGAPAAGTPLINLNGADFVTINGLNTGGNSLTISNTTIGTTTGSGTIRFIADASSNTITNCTILGSSASTLATVAGTIIFSTGTTTGNDNNTISNCNIGPAGANLPSKAIMASGSSSSIENDNVQITGNNIFDFFLPGNPCSGINILTGNEAWTISTNKFYQTGTRTFSTTALRYAAITLNNSTGGFTVSGNTIGFGAANGTGTTTITGSSNEFRGIDAASVRTSAPATEITSNTISGINQTSSRGSTTTALSAFIAVAMGTTDGLLNATGNTIGSLDGSSTIVLNLTTTTASIAPVIGFYNFSFFATNISSNNIGAITIQSTGTTTGFRGILVNTTTGAAFTCNNNTIGGALAANGIIDNQVGSYSMYGIQSALPNLSATGNIIRNMTSSSNGAALIISGGILASGSTGANTISQNQIYSLSNASGAAANSIYGMSLALPTTANLVERNLIHSFSLTSTVTGTQIWGIACGSTGTTTYQNNMIRLGIDAAGGSVTLPTSMIGFRDGAGATNQFYHNSVYIGGSGVLAAPTPSNSYCFFSDVVTVARNFQDNIFWNARGNAVGGGTAHIAIRVGGTTVNPPGLTCNYNDLYFSGTDGATGVYNAVVVPTLAAWRTATGQDANSFAGNPQFIAPNGTAATVELHIHLTNPTQIEGSGLAIGTVTNDYDGQTRGTLTPTDIGADAGNFAPLDLTGPSIGYTALGNTSCTTSPRTLSPVTITDGSGVNTTAGTKPRIYYKKSTDANAFAGNTSGNNGWKFTQATNGASPFSFDIDYTLLQSAVVLGDIIQYFVVAADLASPVNVSINAGTFVGATPVTVDLQAQGVTSIGGSPSSYTITTAGLSGSVNVGPGETYTTLTEAGGLFAAINSSGLSGNLLANITGSISGNNGTNMLNAINANGCAAGPFTLTIKPTVTASVTGSNTAAIIGLNGADFVTIDGSTGATANTVCPASSASRDLTITNTATGSTSDVIWLSSNGADGATNNNIINCNIIGNGGPAAATFAGIFSGGAAGGAATAQNNANKIINNNISKCYYGVFTTGVSAGSKNTGTVISQNTMNAASPNQIGRGGILVMFDDGAVISGNNIDKISGVSTNYAWGISLGLASVTTTTTTGSEVTNATVTNNIIGSVRAASTFGVGGIQVASAASGTTLIANNMISDVMTNGTLGDIGAGIYIGGGAGSTNVYYNSISMTATMAGGSYYNFGIAVNGSNPVVDLRNNIVVNTSSNGATGSAKGLGFAYSTFTNLTSNNNDLFVSGASSAVVQTANLSNSSFTSYTTVTGAGSWNAASGKDANSISVAPVFSGTPYVLSLDAANNTNLNGTGTVVSVTTDIDCQNRTGAGSPDIGADEFTPPVISDLSLFALTSPAAVSCFTASESVVVQVKNVGTSAWDFSVNARTVNATVTNGSPASFGPVTITNAMNGGVPLAANATMNVTLGTLINMQTPQTYTFNASLSASGAEAGGLGATNDALSPAATRISNNPVATLASNSPICTGSPLQLTANSSGGSVGSVAVSSGTLGTSPNFHAIPDYVSPNPGLLTETITLPVGSIPTAADLSVRLKFGHSFSGDLKVTLTAPGALGTTVVFDEIGTSINSNSDNFGTSSTTVTPMPTAIYVFSTSGSGVLPAATGTNPIPAGTYKPSTSANPGVAHNWAGLTFPITDKSGVWTLAITDNVGTDVGDLEEWAIITPGVYTDNFSGAGTFGSITYTGTNNSQGVVSVTGAATGTYSVTTKDANNCTSAQVNTSVTVAAQPTAGTLTPSGVQTAVCAGASVSATATAGSGGAGTTTDELEVSLSGGTYTAYNSGDPIPTAGETSVSIRTRRTATGSGCNASSYNTTSWAVNAQPTAGTLTPSGVQPAVCAGASVSATATAGSGGAGTTTDELEVSLSGGTYTAYNSGDPIPTAGETSVSIRTRRTATGSGCNASSYNTTSWAVNAQPTAGTLTPSGVQTAVCAGASVSATATAGSGGAGTTTDELEVSLSGGTYTAYNSGDPIPTAGETSVTIRTRRTATGSGCNASSYNTTSWAVAAQPSSGTLTPSPAQGNVCAGPNVSATATAGSGGAGTPTDVLQYRINGGTWLAYISGTGIPTTGGSVNSVDIQTYRSATGSGCNSSAPVMVSWTIINGAITGSITSITDMGNATITAACNGDVVQIKANGSVAGPSLQYEWTKGSSSGPILFSLDGVNNWTVSKTTPTNSVYIQFGNIAPSGYSFYKPNVRGTNGCTNSATYGTSIRGTLSGPATLTGQAIVCPSTSPSYTCGSVTGAFKYVWTLTGTGVAGTTFTPNNTNSTTTQVGLPATFVSGSLCVTAQLSCGAPSASAPKCMTITTSVATLGNIVGATSACPGSSQTYTVPSMGGPVTYSWTAPAGSSPLNGTTNSFTTTFPTPYSGNPTVCVTASNNCPAPSTATKCVNVATKTPTQPGAIVGPSANVCAPAGTVIYTVPSQGSSSFNWTYPTGQGTTANSNGDDNVLSFNAPAPPFTSGTVSVVAVNTTCTPFATSPVRALTIKGVPANPASITSTPNPPCAGGNQFTTPGVSGVTNTWATAAGPFDPPAPFGNVGNSVVIDWPANATPYTVNVTASNACGNSGTKVVSFTGTNVPCRIAGTGADEATTNFSAYPNPAHDKLTLSIDANESSNYRLTLMDMAGRSVISESISATAGSSSFNLDLSGLSKGIYMLQVQSANDDWKTKVVVE